MLVMVAMGMSQSDIPPEEPAGGAEVTDALLPMGWIQAMKSQGVAIARSSRRKQGSANEYPLCKDLLSLLRLFLTCLWSGALHTPFLHPLLAQGSEL